MKRIFYVESKGIFVGACRKVCYGRKAEKIACVCGGLNWRKGRKEAEARTMHNLPNIYKRLNTMFDDVVIRFDDGGYYDAEKHDGCKIGIELVEKEESVLNEQP